MKERDPQQIQQSFHLIPGNTSTSFEGAGKMTRRQNERVRAS